ncbi:3-keto-disaccharide hydrolase [Niveispirillum sp. KHB5.9]|uniref:3-keto-disaccharide hydrolase n=1 Tax=Niveispirillum sp. KHB5.9 TaxID=3400269 RepID=UPI003A882B40
MAKPLSRRASLALLAGAAALPLIPDARASSPLPWRPLIPATPAPDGSIPGWRRLGGHAPYRLEKGEIIGTSVEKSRNSFLVSDELFDDFILECQVKTDPRLNTGIMIRSESKPDYRDGVVHGYQVEIDHAARRWTGGIYDEQRRLWLATPAHRPDTQASFKSGDWNHIRVEAVGTRIRTWLNGLPAANVVDDMTPRGFFGLQVHDVGPDPANAGLEVRFKDLRVITDDPGRYTRRPLDVTDEQDFIANHLTRERVALGWRLLWDGKGAGGWSGLSGRGWSIADGAIIREGAEGAIVSADRFGDFDLELDVQAVEGADGAVGYLGGAFYRLAQGSQGQGETASGSLEGKVGASNLTDPNPDKPSMKPAGHWNRVRILVQGDRVEHWLNGSKLVAGSRAGFGLPASGPVSLRPGAGRLSFRSIRIRPL